MKNSILQKTFHGLKIYAFILKQYYPNDRINRINGRGEFVVKNPFNDDKETLYFEVKGPMARHRDLEREDLAGDVFDFANRYFKADSKEELYHLLNQALELGLDQDLKGKSFRNWQPREEFWRPQVSYFKAPISNIYPSEELRLWEVHSRIKGEGLLKITRELRKIEDPKKKRAFKAKQFPYVCFSGTFLQRSDQKVAKLSGLMVLDFDKLPEVASVRELLLADPHFETELLFVSPSGNGLKWVIRHHSYDTSHRDYFLAVSNYLEKKYSLTPDISGKDISRACFLAHDPEAYLHPRHMLFSETWLRGTEFEKKQSFS